MACSSFDSRKELQRACSGTRDDNQQGTLYEYTYGLLLGFRGPRSPFRLRGHSFPHLPKFPLLLPL